MVTTTSRAVLKTNKHLGLGGSSRLCRTTPKLKIKFLSQTDRTHMLSFVDVGPAVSEPCGLENVDTARTDGRTDGRTDIRTVLQVISGEMAKNNSLSHWTW